MTQVYITDDHTIVRQGLRALIEELEGFAVAGEAADGQTLLAQLAHVPVDVLLMDLSMPRLDGLGALQQIKAQYPQVRVCILTMHEEPYYIRQLVKAGADAYLIKNGSRDELVAALRALQGGQKYFPPAVSQLIMQDLSGAPAKVPLTRREKEVLQLLAADLTTAEIADRLHLSTHTVDSHRKNMLQKLQCKSTVGLVRYALENGLA